MIERTGDPQSETPGLQGGTTSDIPPLTIHGPSSQ